MIIIFIGPSGAGKSELTKIISNKYGYINHDLDAETSIHADFATGKKNFLGEARHLLTKYSADTEATHVIDVGAGFQHTPEFFEIIQPFFDAMINVNAIPEEIYPFRKEGRTLEQFIATEYTDPHRKKLYDSARYQVMRMKMDDEVKVVSAHLRSMGAPMQD